jgi:hypothetical protein
MYKFDFDFGGRLTSKKLAILYKDVKYVLFAF